MEALDFLYEAVKNSIEAKADSICVSLDQAEGRLHVTVVDDGQLSVTSDPFAPGYSTKGKGRGRGLSLLKSFDEGASLARENGKTILSFCLDADGPLKAEETLPLLFSLCWENGVKLGITLGDRFFSTEKFALELGALNEGSAIARMKREITSKDNRS